MKYLSACLSPLAAVFFLAAATGPARGSEQPSRIDIAPFALPNTPAEELWFEEPRDIVRLVVELTNNTDASIGVSYRRHYWPETKVEERAKEDPMGFGWIPQDDLFNGTWQQAAVSVERHGRNTFWITFRPLTEEFPEEADYAVELRRSVAFRIDGGRPEGSERLRAYTASPPERTQLRVA
ncbi:MAG: hypothetical protein HYZ00_11755, partial [Candidatus Hydrogenedentes bacterium]|nr:hypothetical protein [Candidatus Hydrogenedentota bacterium]